MFGALAQSLASLGTGLVCTGGVQCVAAWHAAGAGHPDTGMGGEYCSNRFLLGPTLWSCLVSHSMCGTGDRLVGSSGIQHCGAGAEREGGRINRFRWGPALSYMNSRDRCDDSVSRFQ